MEPDLLIVTAEEEGERLDKVLASRFREGYSRTYFQRLIEEHLVLVNGEPSKKRVFVREGDEIEVAFAATPEIALKPEAIPLDIIYEDEYLLAINKPAGLVVHPAPGNREGTFVNALLYHCASLEVEEGSLRPGIVHRLDKDTSGVLVAAKTLRAHQKMTALFASREVEKEYLAVCVGCPQEGTIDAPIGRHPVKRKEMAVVPGGRKAISHVSIVEKKGPLTVVKVAIETGRTHQIRVHLRYRGAPVLGDAVYGLAAANAKYGVERQLLHASVLRFVHPFSGESLVLQAPIPEDMRKWIA